MFWRGRKSFHSEFVALDNVSFSVEKGQAIGVLGRNGSGKSTLLQMICGTLQPSSGEVVLSGRVAALLELGAGFNPQFTGRENIWVAATILGLTENQIKQRFDAIIEFADIGDFLDRPVNTYSSGMYMRLAFAVNIHVDPEILIIDEALAVGDARFQQKCIKRLEEFKKQGVTIFFVSHADEQIRRFCDAAVWLDKGKVAAIGEVNQVVDKYREHLALGSDNAVSLGKSDDSNESIPSDTMAMIRNFDVSAECLKPFDELYLDIEYEVFDIAISGFLLGVAIYDTDRNYIFGPNTHLDNFTIPSHRGLHKVRYLLPKLPLLARDYHFDIGIFTEKGMVCLDYRTNAKKITVESDYFTEGLVYLDHKWSVLSNN
jgi:ABC-type polysaccharide/polyol phosphate transport system ATPase subunit